MGEAYTVFDCTAETNEIEKEMTFIRQLIKSPETLKITLTPVKTGNNIPPAEEKKTGRLYAIIMNIPNATNKETANELATILNQAYQTPLWQQ